MSAANRATLVPTNEQPYSDAPNAVTLTAGAAVTSASPRTLRAVSSGTILLADDDLNVRSFVATILREQGYHVLVAENGRKALEQCAQFPGQISALITDAVMPELNGRELVEQARQMRPNLKVLLMSGYVDRGPKEGNPSNPTYAFLEKPFSSETLVEKVESLCASANWAAR